MCTYQGIKVPCLIRFSKSSSINGLILRDILKYIDHLDLLKREKDPNVTLFFLADAHGSRFFTRIPQVHPQRRT